MTNMPERTNWSLVVALSLPVVMVIVVALSIYVPARFQRFTGQFLYSVQQNGYYGFGNGFRVMDGKLEQVPVTRPPYAVNFSTPSVQLYIHDIATDTSREITLAQARALQLDPSLRSSEGLQIDYGSQSDGVLPFLLFSRPDFSTVYAKGDRGSRKLNVRVGQNVYVNQFQFIGWVKS